MNPPSYKHLQEFHLQRNNLNERINTYGHKSLTDEELLHFLTLIPITKLKELIKKHGLKEIIKFVDGSDFTSPQRKKLEMLFEFAKRLSLAPFKEKPLLDSSSKVGEFLIGELGFEHNEKFVILLLDSQNRLISKEVLFSGTINEAPLYPRLIVQKALNQNANAIICGHNHPGGSLNPSSSDIESTKKIGSALTSIGIKLIDHLIIAEGKYVSFAEKGLL